MTGELGDQTAPEQTAREWLEEREDEMLARMQTPAAIAGIKRFFDADPSEYADIIRAGQASKPAGYVAMKQAAKLPEQPQE